MTRPNTPHIRPRTPIAVLGTGARVPEPDRCRRFRSPQLADLIELARHAHPEQPDPALVTFYTSADEG